MPPSKMSEFLAHWTVRGLSELEQFPTPESRAAALEAYTREQENLIGPRWWMGVVLAVGASFAVTQFSARLLPAFFPRIPGAGLDIVTVVLGLLTFVVLLRSMHRWGAARALRGYLLDNGVPICRGCGAALTDTKLSLDECVLCGEPFDDQTRTVLGRPVVIDPFDDDGGGLDNPYL